MDNGKTIWFDLLQHTAVTTAGHLTDLPIDVVIVCCVQMYNYLSSALPHRELQRNYTVVEVQAWDERLLQ